MRLSFNLTQKFIGFLLLTSFIPLLFVGTSSYRVAYEILRREATKYNLELVRNQEAYLDLQLRQVESLIYNLSGVTDIINAVQPQQENRENTYSSLTTQARIGYILNGYANLDGLVSIDVFGADNTHYHVGDTLDVSDVRLSTKEEILKQVTASTQRIVWVGVEDNVNLNSKEKKVITAATLLKVAKPHTLNREIAGLLIVNCNIDNLYEHFSKIDLGKGGYLLVVDAKNRIIYHPDKSAVGQEINPKLLEMIRDKRGVFVETIDSEKVLITYAKSEVSNWTIFSFVPIGSLLSGTVAIGAATSLALLVSFGIVLLAAWLISKKIVSPIRQITEKFQSFQAGELDVDSHLPVESDDEVGELSRWFNTFLDGLATQKQVEMALRESEERYSLALQGAKDGIWDWDLRTNVIHYSPRWKMMLGYGKHELSNCPEDWFDRIHPVDVTQVIADLANHLSGVTAHFESEHRLLMGDGNTYCWVLARGLAIRDAQQQATRLAGSLTDITSRKDTEERLRHDALHDGLTRLPNRMNFMGRLEQVLEEMEQCSGELSAIISLDLDRFKIINDSLGHAAGDHLLMQVSERLQSCLRPRDTVARFGGDEFAFLLVDMPDRDYVVAIATRIQEVLSHPIRLESHEVSVTGSLGITHITPLYVRPDDLLRDADIALYQAKAKGKACFAVFDEAMHQRTLDLLRLEGNLRRAIEREEFSIAYQPIVSLGEQAMTAVEALIRWKSAELGQVSPADFIPLAEETGLILPIGEWVLWTACRQAKIWYDQGHTRLKVSVNLSARQLQGEALLELVSTVLAETGLPAVCLQLEITESVAMADVGLTYDLISRLRAMGVQIAIDDFGTSYSSLGYLKRFPVSGIKIDRSFIKDVGKTEDANAIASAIIAMAHILGLAVTAEGVETAEQLAFLQAHQCDPIQGFLISAALPAEDVINLANVVIPRSLGVECIA